MEGDSQQKILESLTKDDYKNIILPSDDFFDSRSASSISDLEDSNKNENEKDHFDHNKNKKYILYYFCETVLKIDSKNAKFINRVNLNDLTVYNRNLPWFDENLFPILVDMCKKEDKNIYFDPDYIINNINGQILLDGIEKCKENIQYFTNWISKDKIYDLIGEVSIDYLTNPNNSEFVKISKYIEFIKLFKSIKNQMEINSEIKKKFEEKFGLIYDNEKVLIMTFDGNYNEYLNFLKYSKIFQNEKDNKSNIIEDNITFNQLNYNEINNMNSINCCNFDKNMDAHNNMSQNMLNKIKNSGINCIIIYVPRSNVNVKSNYSINSNEFLELKKDVEKLKNNVIDLTNDTNLLKEKVRKLEEGNKEVKNLMEEIRTKIKEINA